MGNYTNYWDGKGVPSMERGKGKMEREGGSWEEDTEWGKQMKQ